MGEIVLIRHGETAWSAIGRHTSVTDLDLTATGEHQARTLTTALAERHFTAVLCSPRRRALRTAQLAGLTTARTDDGLAEWDYGEYEGLTMRQIRDLHPGWDLWHDGCPGGESPRQVADRLDGALDRIRTLLVSGGDVAVVGHGHALRVAAARWIGLPPSGGGRLRLDVATISTLGFEHEREVVLTWNVPAAG